MINKKIKSFEFKLNKFLSNSFIWNNKNILSWSGIDFLEHKEYNIWDSTKNIDWKLYSKTQKLYSKFYEEDRLLDVVFLIDMSFLKNTFLKDDKKELFLEVFYALSYSFVKNDDNIAVYFYWLEKDIYYDFSKWALNTFKTIWFIEDSDLNLDESKDFSYIIDKLSKINLKNKLIINLSDRVYETINNKTLKLSNQNQFLYINLFDYFENNLEYSDSNITLSNNNDFINISLNNKEKIDQFKKIRHEKINKFKYNLLKNKINYLYIDTKDDLYKKIFIFLKTIK